MLKFIMTRIALIACLCSLSVSAYAVADGTKHAINIPPEDLSTALEQLSKQSGTDVVYRPEQVRGYSTRALVGQYSAEEAVAKLIKGTSLTLSMDSSGALLIAAPLATTATGAQSSPGMPDGQPPPEQPRSSLQLAQVDEGQTSGASTVEKQGEQPPKRKPVLEEVVVTGSRIPTAAGQQPVPVRVYTRQDIENSGQTAIADFLGNQPDVSLSYREDGSLVGGFPGRTTVQLHGLPIGTTLVLLNGRRVETSTLGYFDLNSIPLSAVERIEILPVGASAIYGADALGGAVNIILRRNFSGFEANGMFGHADDLNDGNGNVAWGRSWERGSISLVGTYQQHGQLLGSERPLTSTTNFPNDAPSSLVSSLLTDDCYPGNVYSLNGQNLPGLSSPQAGIPTGISGTPTTQQFVASAGKLNACNTFRNIGLIPYTQRTGALLSAHYQVAESMDLFTEVIFSHEHLEDLSGLLIDAYGGSYGGATLGANNPYNPFGQAVGISYSYPGIGENQDELETFIHPLIGARGSVFTDWHYEATAYLSHDRFQSDSPFGGDSGTLQAALNSSDPATALNPFTNGAPGSPQLLQSLIRSAAQFNFRFINQILDGQAILRGPLLSLPAGPLEAVVGAEYSREEQYSNYGSSEALIDLQRRAYAGFVEGRLPLIGVRDRPEGGDQLTLTFAGRYDHAGDFGGKATWQGGVLWRPTETLTVTGGYGLSYKAPELLQIGGPQNVLFGSAGVLMDPFRGNALVPPITVVSGPNFNLKPETGDSRTLGITYRSQAQQGFAASLTYFALNIKNYIATHDLQTLIDDPSLFPGAIIRGPTTAQDVQQGFLGPITQINNAYYNFGDLSIAGFDADLSYMLETAVGQLTPYVSVANIYKWQSALTPNSPSVSYVSQANLDPGWAPRWKGTAGLSWKRGPLSASLTGRYVGPYNDYTVFVPNHGLGNSWIFDTNTRYQFGHGFANDSGWLAGTYIALGAVNLLNKAPPLSYFVIPYDATQYDIRGRFVYTQVGVKW